MKITLRFMCLPAKPSYSLLVSFGKAAGFLGLLRIIGKIVETERFETSITLTQILHVYITCSLPRCY